MKVTGVKPRPGKWSGRRNGQTPIAAEQLGYGYDPGWNMTNRSANGVGTTYTVNDLNRAVCDKSSK